MSVSRSAINHLQTWLRNLEERSKFDSVLEHAKHIGLVGWINDCIECLEFCDENLIVSSSRYLDFPAGPVRAGHQLSYRLVNDCGYERDCSKWVEAKILRRRVKFDEGAIIFPRLDSEVHSGVRPISNFSGGLNLLADEKAYLSEVVTFLEYQAEMDRGFRNCLDETLKLLMFGVGKYLFTKKGTMYVLPELDLAEARYRIMDDGEFNSPEYWEEVLLEGEGVRLVGGDALMGISLH